MFHVHLRSIAIAQVFSFIKLFYSQKIRMLKRQIFFHRIKMEDEKTRIQVFCPTTGTARSNDQINFHENGGQGTSTGPESVPQRRATTSTPGNGSIKLRMKRSVLLFRVVSRNGLSSITEASESNKMERAIPILVSSHTYSEWNKDILGPLNHNPTIINHISRIITSITMEHERRYIIIIIIRYCHYRKQRN